MSESDLMTVMVVDDRPDITDTYALWLEDDYEVIKCYSGKDTVESIEDSVDVVLLDRRMPNMYGDEVLRELRERGYGSKVVMVTAVEPDFDVLDMSWDDYMVKPISSDGLEEKLENFSELRTYEDEFHAYYRLLAKKSLMESKKMHLELESNEKYAELESRIERLEDEILSDSDLESARSKLSVINEAMDND